jgi:hypothetical protein
MGIEIEPAVFAHDDGRACANESFVVLGAADPGSAVRALERSWKGPACARPG